jgi:hypothetical protein
MQGNLHVPFLGGWAGAIPPGYPAHEETYGNATRLVPTQQGYCWRIQKCCNLCVQHAFTEGKKAEKTFLIHSGELCII